MPTQPDGERGSFERQTFDVLDPGERAAMDQHPTRRKMLAMVTGGIAATAAVGTVSAAGRPTAAASSTDKPTVTASSTACGVVDLDYTDRGPKAEVSLVGPESATVTLEVGGSDQVEVAAGSYDVEARPVGSSGGDSSIAVVGSPVDVEPCSVPSIEAAVMWCGDMFADVELKNPLDACVPVEVEYWSGGSYQSDSVFSLGAGETELIELNFSLHDEWHISAYSPETADNCSDTSGDTIAVNDQPSPLRLTGSDCDTLTAEIEGV